MKLFQQPIRFQANPTAFQMRITPHIPMKVRFVLRRPRQMLQAAQTSRTQALPRLNLV